jgi:hypothetical protein
MAQGRSTARRKNGATTKTQRSRGGVRRRRISSGALGRATKAISRAISPDVAARRDEVSRLVCNLEERVEQLDALTAPHTRPTTLTISSSAPLPMSLIACATPRAEP